MVMSVQEIEKAIQALTDRICFLYGQEPAEQAGAFPGRAAGSESRKPKGRTKSLAILEAHGVMVGSGGTVSSLVDDAQNRWQVLVIGESFQLPKQTDDPDNQASFALRDQARERLRSQLTILGITPKEYTWVWDDTDRVQVVVAAFPDEGQALMHARRLHRKGLKVRVTLSES